jgi:hypothetical protein
VSGGTSTFARANSAARFDEVILIYDSLFILLKSLTLDLHVDIGASILKLVSVHPNFVAWVVLDWWMEIQQRMTQSTLHCTLTYIASSATLYIGLKS